ncbi:hypothetical protein BDF21DRAFT_477225 [Thamnidium elegans]|nr:hypothetical protein BDF21DRAFT_477225 [Thamnidium elegans]
MLLVRKELVRIVVHWDTQVWPTKFVVVMKNICENQKKSRFVIKTSLKNTINLANNEVNASFCVAVQKAVSHYRDVTSTTSLFVNFFILELLSAGMPIPPLTHTFLYDFASLVMNIGSKTLPHVIESFNCFTEMLGDTYIPERFYSQGFTTVVTAIIRSYSALIHNHVADNYKKRSLRFFLHVYLQQIPNFAFLARRLINENWPNRYLILFQTILVLAIKDL